MSHGLLPLVEAISGLEVLVLGEAMLDTYLSGTTGRLCREAPVPIVALEERSDAPGGAANTAVNAAALGARTHFLSVVGDDEDGRSLGRELNLRGVDCSDVLVDASRRTLSKTRVVAASQLLVRFDQGSIEHVSQETERELIRRLSGLAPRCDVILISDYGYGILTPGVIAALADLQRGRPRVLVVDAKDLPAYREAGVTAVKPNYGEAVGLFGGSCTGRSRVDFMLECGGQILDRTGARIAAITLDTDGAVVVERERPAYRTYARPTRHSRAAGAGDTFLATMGLALAAGAETPAAADLASAACEIVVSREGTAACTAAGLRERLSGESKVSADVAGLLARLDGPRREGRRVVFTNGCFDILHRGHVSYLSRAKSLGDLLVVGVNTDAGIHRLKGPLRPINTLEDRMGVLAALSCVDHLIAFDEETPCELIAKLRPDVFVKGGDYSLDRLPEAPIVRSYGGSVEILPFLAVRSTTGIIDRIRAAYGGSAQEFAVPAREVFGPEVVGGRV